MLRLTRSSAITLRLSGSKIDSRMSVPFCQTIANRLPAAAIALCICSPSAFETRMGSPASSAEPSGRIRTTYRCVTRYVVGVGRSPRENETRNTEPFQPAAPGEIPSKPVFSVPTVNASPSGVPVRSTKQQNTE